MTKYLRSADVIMYKYHTRIILHRHVAGHIEVSLVLEYTRTLCFKLICLLDTENYLLYYKHHSFCFSFQLKKNTWRSLDSG